MIKKNQGKRGDIIDDEGMEWETGITMILLYRERGHRERDERDIRERLDGRKRGKIERINR